MPCFLGIDAGTSGVKAIIIDETGNVRGIGYEEADVLSPRPGWIEQNPEDWWKATNSAVKQAVAASGAGSEVAAIGFSGQMQGSVLVDRNGNAIGNCMIWLDQRAQQEVEDIAARIDDETYLSLTANSCLNSFWAPKLLWLKKNEPETFERIWKVLFPKDYIRFRMTGEACVEVSDASLSGLMNVPKRRWEPEIFERIGIPLEIVPETMCESPDVTGQLLPEVAAAWGVPAGIPVVAGGGDQPAGGVGTGITRAGIIGATIGTSGVVFGCTDEPLIDHKKRALMTMAHSVPGKFCFLGLVLTAGGAFKWLRDHLFANEKEKLAGTGEDIYDYMTGLAAKAPAGSEGLLFQPYLNGEKTPVSDPNARATFFGLSQRHGLPEICRAVMEGVTYALKDTIEICREFGIPVDEVRVNGGGAKSALWRQIQADIYNADVITMNMEEGPAAGGAIMAAVGSGHFATVEEACDAILKITGVTKPIADNVRRYEDFYGIYRDLYPALRGLYERDAQLITKYLA